jgi:5-(carboxyamino)imidazole ribonucleotide synthase
MENILALADAHYHSYGKEPRPNRKLGHVTITSSSPASRDKALRQLLRAYER